MEGETPVRRLYKLSLSIYQIYQWPANSPNDAAGEYFRGIHRALDCFTFEMWFSGENTKSWEVLRKDIDALYEEQSERESDSFAQGYTDVAKALRRRYDKPRDVAQDMDPESWVDQ